MQSLGIKYKPAVYATLTPNATSADYLKLSIGTLYPAVYHILATYATSGVYTQSSTEIALRVKNFLSAINWPAAMTPTSTGYKYLVDLLPAITITNARYGKDLSNLAKIYIDKAKYSGHNDNFTFKLENL